jgi:hypothetical protein
MSLKAFHVVFIVASVLMAWGVGAWELNAYHQGGQWFDLVLGLGASLSGAGLLVYGRYFLKKLKHISYL